MLEAGRLNGGFRRGLGDRRTARPKEASLDGVTAIAEQLLRANGLESGEATLYVEITRGTAPRTHYFPVLNPAPTMLVMASAFTPSNARFTGARVITQPDVRWSR